MFSTVFFLVGAFVGSIILTWFFRRHALAKCLLDIPNHRSSHTVPTPRGGGVAIVVVFAVLTTGLFLAAMISTSAYWGILGGGLLVACVSYYDDHGHVSARWRFLVHLVASVWVLAWLGPLAPLNTGFTVMEPGWFGAIMATLFIVWMVNLYNFMDGIDGLAGVQAISVAFAMAVINMYQGANGVALWLALLGATSAGFLIWNWPPAKIFMGDVGSSFLGLTFAAFALLSHNQGIISLWSWLIICGVFVVDASVTLLVRFIGRQIWYQPHRSHAYQWASRVFGSHKLVTLVVLAINGLWLFPLAWYAAVEPALGLVLLCIAYTPLLLIVFRFHAGKPEVIA